MFLQVGRAALQRSQAPGCTLEEKKNREGKHKKRYKKNPLKVVRIQFLPIVVSERDFFLGLPGAQQSPFNLHIQV